MKRMELATSSHALLSVLSSNGIDRVFLVPGESYLGILDALGDFPEIDVVTCRHEGGAGFMACADGRLTRRPGVVMVSRARCGQCIDCRAHRPAGRRSLAPDSG